jgi:hypothetical protein
MTRTLRRATRAPTALFVAAFLSGCYTAAPPPQASPSGSTSHGYANYATPSSSFGIAVFTSAPRSPGYDGSIWYYGNHPHPANHAFGSFCRLHGSHRHDYAPYRSHRYAFHDGHYFWVGDAKPYALRGHSYAYHGHHPHPHYFGGYCRIRGLHQHGYAPRSADYYRLKSGAYFFTGAYGPDYYAERNRYDARGWRLDHRARGYREHERAWQEERAVDATRENRLSHSRTRRRLSREESAGSDAVDRGSPTRQQGRQKAARPAVASPHGAVGVIERMDAHRVTPRELMERMRERTRDASRSARANGAADGVPE